MRTEFSIVELLPSETGGTTGAGRFGNVAQSMLRKGDLNHFRERKEGLAPFSSPCPIPSPHRLRYTFYTMEKDLPSPIDIVMSKKKTVAATN